MITVNDIKDVRFRKTNIGGYRPEDVDTFLDEVQDSYEKLQRENLSLTQKIKILADRINQYRQDEDSVKTALVSAQKLADLSVQEAKKEAEAIINAAKSEAERIVAAANNEILAQKETLMNLKKAVKEFRANILSLYKEHLKLVNSFNAEDRLPVNLVEAPVQSEQNEQEETSEPEVNQNVAQNVVDIRSTSDNKETGNVDDTSNKFTDLKFGEDYDVSKDANESPLGLFN